MTKVGKSDREGTFAGTAGNDGDAPGADLRGPSRHRQSSVERADLFGYDTSF